MNPDYLVFAIVLIARVGIPLLIPRFTLPAMIAALVIDGIDQTIFQQFTDMDLSWYQGYDKALDIYYLSIAYLSSMRNWSHLFAFKVNMFLYYYRLVGVLLFELFNARWLLLVFPNTFEYFFDFYEGVRSRWDPRRMSRRLVIGAAAFIWIVIKLPQEWWIHVAQLDATDFIKEDIFGMSADDSWGTVFSENLGLCLGILAVAIGLIALARWYVLHRLPEADWRWTFDADAPGRDTKPIEAHRVYQAGPKKIFGFELYEKVAMIVLVSVIFSQILPGINLSNLELGVGVAIWIVLNTALSEWLSRRGVDFGSALRQFILMAGLNLGIITVAFVILRNGTDEIHFGNTLFFALLLALMITLYDRYRPIHAERFELGAKAGNGEA